MCGKSVESQHVSLTVVDNGEIKKNRLGEEVMIYLGFTSVKLWTTLD